MAKRNHSKTFNQRKFKNYLKKADPSSRSRSSHNKKIPKSRHIQNKYKEFVAEEAAEDNDEEVEREMGEAEVERMREKYRPKNNNYQDFLQQDSEDIARQYIERERMERTNRREAANQVPTLKDPKLFSCLLYTSPSPRDQRGSRMPSSA